jgi:hypothetical protein
MSFSLFSLLPLGEGLGMRAYERNLSICSVVAEWHSTTRISSGVDAHVSPHPDPLPEGEGDKSLDFDLKT